MYKRKNIIILIVLLVFSIQILNVSAEEEMDFLELCKKGNYGEIRIALEKGADVNQVNADRVTPLMCAARYNTNPNVIGLLRSSGALINRRDKDGESALFYAIHNNNPLVLNVLISLGANVNIINKSGKNALTKAIEAEKEDAVRMLVRAGSNVNIKCRNGWSPLMYAVYKNNYRIVEYIINSGVMINSRNDDGQTALMVALKNKSRMSIIEKLLMNNADVGIRDNEGMSALLYAARYNGNREIIKLLLENGAGINMVDKLGKNALLHNLEGNNISLSLIDYLLFKGINVNYQDIQGRAALVYAVIHTSNSRVIQMLLDAGADVNLRDRYKGITPLMYAVRENNNPVIAYMLLDAGADPIARDFQGKRVVDYLEENKALKGTDIYWELKYFEPEKSRIELESFKDVQKAGLLAAFVPSAGHYYAENWSRGSCFLFGELATIAVGLNQDGNSRNICIGIFALLKAWEIHDAVKITEDYNDFVEEYNKEAVIYNKLFE